MGLINLNTGTRLSDKYKAYDSQKFAMWLAIAGITMMFMALTSAYIVRKASGNWLEFTLPPMFFISTGVILFSSVTLHISYKSYLNRNVKAYRLFLLITFLLGILFVVTQYLGWKAMEEMGVYLTGNPSGSFVYAISGLHIAHVFGGVAALIVAIIHAFFLKFKVTKKRKTRFQLVTHYWHFVDILWVYLLVFFMVQ